MVDLHRIYIPYVKKVMNEREFFKFTEKRFFQTVRQFSMIKAKEKIAVGLSGGKDSSVLLYLLKKLQKKMPIKLHAIIVDEGIKGYRDKSIKNAIKLAEKLEVDYTLKSFYDIYKKTIDDIAEEKMRTCTYCGVMRRTLLNKIAREINANKLAIGHNLDDLAQTVLMNIMRNEPLRLARIISPIVESKLFIPRIKPLIRIPEREIAAYAVMKNLPVDLEPCPYTQNAFRNIIKHKLNEIEEQYPGTKFKIFNSFLFLEKLIRKENKNKKINYCKICGEPSSEEICMKCKLLGDF